MRFFVIGDDIDGASGVLCADDQVVFPGFHINEVGDVVRDVLVENYFACCGGCRNVEASLFDDMIRVAKILSKGIKFVRVDLYCINNQVYFSELTFTPAKGTLIFDDDKADFEIGEWLKI